MASQLRCGRIAYTNDLPIYAAFDLGAIAYPGTLYAGVPSRLNAMLLAGELDVSPISAYTWARHFEELVLLPDLCIGARDEVVSVVLASSIAPALLDGTRIFVTQESATSTNLLRILLERRYGVQPIYVDEAAALDRALQGDPTLLIGDSAIEAAANLPAERVYDLGTLWHEWTGEQIVFAVWAARRESYERDPDAIRSHMRLLTDGYTWSRAHERDVVALAESVATRPAGFYNAYYGKLNFMFHTAAQQGLAAYCRELVAIGALARMPSMRPQEIDALAR